MFRFRVLPSIQAYAMADFPTVAYRQRATSLVHTPPALHAWARLADDLLEIRRLAFQLFNYSPKEVKQLRKALSSRVKLYFFGTLRRHAQSAEARRAMRQAIDKLAAADFPLYSKVPPLYRPFFWLFVQTGFWFPCLTKRQKSTR